MSQLDSYLKTIMNKAVGEAPADLFSSVESMVEFADRAGEIAVQESIKWQPKRAKVIPMPDRRKRSKQ